MPLISIIVPCRNEARYIEKCIRSIRSFDMRDGVSMEVFLADGLSEDRTREIIIREIAGDARFQLLTNEKITQAAGLNLCIGQAKGEYIMRLDAHSEYPEDYLEKCYETAVRTGADNVGGQIIPGLPGNNPGSHVVMALTTHPFGVGNSPFRVGAVEGPARTVPFGFFRRETFQTNGLFDERLVRCQDYEFNQRILRNGGKIWINPAIRVVYFNQSSLWAFLRKQFFKEAPYNAYMWYLYPYTFSLRHAITPIFSAWVILGAVLSWLFPLIASIYLIFLGLYASLAIFSAVQQSIRYKKGWLTLLLPCSFFLFHMCHGLGTWRGSLMVLFQRDRNLTIGFMK